MASPTNAAFRRGLGVEGLGLMFGGFWAQGVTSSNTTNIGLMALTGVSSKQLTFKIMKTKLSQSASNFLWVVDKKKVYSILDLINKNTFKYIKQDSQWGWTITEGN